MKLKGNLNIQDQPVGFIVQRVEALATAEVLTNAIVPMDNTIPQIGEGTQALALTITPKKIGNFIVIEVSGYLSSSSGAVFTILSLHRTGTNDALISTAISNILAPVHMTYTDTATGVSSVEYTIRLGNQASGNVRLQEGYFGVAGRATLRATEYSQ